MAIEYFGKTDVGKVRTNNEDYFLIDENIGLFIVADGMGGANAGEVASRMAVELISKNLRRFIEHQKDGDSSQVILGKKKTDVSETANYLLSCIRLANQAIFEASHTYAQNRGMGTTVAAVLVNRKTYIIGWVGDSRVYIVRNGLLQQMTKDHSFVQEQINKGLITKEQAEVSEYKNVLTRALGTEENVEPDITETTAARNDYLLICSDGLTRTVSDEAILQTIKNLQKPEEICQNLIGQANKAGGKDNITAIVLTFKSKHLLDKILKIVDKTA